MATSTRELTATAESVRFEDGRMVVRLVDGRDLGIPLDWFPRLAEATPDARSHWRLIGRGTGIHWPDLDEDISVPRLLGLPCE